MISMIVDIETVALNEAASYVPPVQAPAREGRARHRSMPHRRHRLGQ